MESPKISDAEWEVMKVLWATSCPCTANQVVENLAESTDWKPNTIKTLINRLVKKQVVDYKEVGRVYYYYPLLTESQCVKAESESFLKKVFGGAIKPMLVTFLTDEKLSQAEIEELKRLLDERKQ